ncbi:MAG: hypothetical protein U5K31_06270 [Balneolaceae bacterium]|nr:hypothetical protein [Balneolaceae bacterium]
MSKSTFEQLKEKFLDRWNRIVRRPDDEGVPDVRREKVAVFVVAFVLALGLWLLVELSSEFPLTLNMPLELGNMPADRALVEELPDMVTVNVTGEGWDLITLYNNPTPIYVDVTESEINLSDEVRRHITRPGITVQRVQPLTLSLEMEERVSRTVSVTPHVELGFRERFGQVSEARVVPDSVTITGAASLVDTLTSWPTRPTAITGIGGDVSRELELQDPGELIELDRQAVSYQMDVSEFTEAEVRVPITTQNLPPGRSVNYSPSVLTVTYDVPIDQYRLVEDQVPFNAWVTYEQILSDSTGFVTPELEISAKDLNLRLRSQQPSEVAYFIVMDN